MEMKVSLNGTTIDRHVFDFYNGRYLEGKGIFSANNLGPSGFWVDNNGILRYKNTPILGNLEITVNNERLFTIKSNGGLNRAKRIHGLLTHLKITSDAMCNRRVIFQMRVGGKAFKTTVLEFFGDDKLIKGGVHSLV